MPAYKRCFMPTQMDEKSRQLESELESSLQENDHCLLTGEATSLYVDDVTIASLPNGCFSFSVLSLEVLSDKSHLHSLRDIC